MAGHGHPHGQGAHGGQRSRRKLLAALAIGTLVLAAEVAGGLLANSLALLADAGHYLVDLASLLLALLAVSWGLRPPTKRKTFGHRRAEVVAAFVQAIALWAVVAVLLVEAARRLRDPPPVEAPLVMAVAAGTLAADLALALWLRAGAGAANLSVRAASLHLLGDALGSLAALASGALVHFWGLRAADPVVTVLLAGVLLAFAWRLTRQSLHILLEGVPVHIDADAVAALLAGAPGVASVHDLHVWTHTPGVESLTAHVVLAGPADDRLAADLRERVRQGFGIEHITLQVEGPGTTCTTVQHAWEPPRKGRRPRAERPA